MSPPTEAGQLQIDDIEADQDIVIRECVDVFNRMDLTHEEQCDRCRQLIVQHMIRIREIWLRRLERELVDRIPGFPPRGGAGASSPRARISWMVWAMAT